MRGWLVTLAVLALCALGERPASAQSLDCAEVPQSVCESEEILALEGDRAALIEQLAGLDPQHAAIAGEQTWIDGLSACGDDLECYRAAYLSHNQALHDSVGALAIAEEPLLEEPPDAGELEEQLGSEDIAPARRAARDSARDRDGPVYVPSGLPGWGFFTAIGVTLLILYALLRARARNRDALHEEEAYLRDDWR